MKAFTRLCRFTAPPILVLTGTLFVAAHTQAAPGDVDLSFTPPSSGDYTDGTIASILVHAHGKVLIGGSFSVVQGVVRSRLARLEADGSVDTTFTATVDGSAVYALLEQPDGRILIGGRFTTVNGAPRSGVARLNPDGTLDTTFDPGMGAEGEPGLDWVDGTVYALTLQTDGKVLIAGGFTSVNGVDRNSVARLNVDGSLDTSFDSTVGSRRQVKAMALQPDGKVIVGGYIRSALGASETPFLIRLNADGTMDPSFRPTFSGESWVRCLALQPDGRVIVGGGFSRINNASRRLARLNTDGTLDDSFVPANGSEIEPTALELQPDGKVVVCDWYTGQIFRLDRDGSLDTTFAPSEPGPSWIEAAAIASQSDGKLLFSVSFLARNSVPQPQLVRLSANGELDDSFRPKVSSGFLGPRIDVRAILLQTDGKVVIGGQFATTGNEKRENIARLDGDGSLDASFDPGTAGKEWNDFRAIAQQSDGKLIIGGYFATVSGEPYGVARLHPDGRLDDLFVPELGLAGFPFAYVAAFSIGVQPDDRILIGGRFNLVNGVDRFGLARLESDGTLDTTFDSSLSRVSGPDNVIVHQIVLQPDGKVLVSGDFDFVEGEPRGKFARLNGDGSLDRDFAPDWPDNFLPRSFGVALQPDGKILVPGSSAILRLLPDGRVDQTFDVSTKDFFVQSTLVQPDGKILLTRSLSSSARNPTINGIRRNGVARLHPGGSVDLGFDPGSGPDGAGGFNGGNTMALQPDGKVLIGGLFSVFHGIPRPGVVRLHGGEGDAQPTTGVIPLRISRSGQDLVLSWAAAESAGYSLESTASLSAETAWEPVLSVPPIVGDQHVVIIPAVEGARFYRLRK